MPADTKSANQKVYDNIVVTDNVKSYADDHFFIAKLEKAKKSLSKVKFPENMKKQLCSRQLLENNICLRRLPYYSSSSSSSV